MNEPELWLPKTIETLPALLVVPNGTIATCRVREVDGYLWEEKPKSVLLYYRPATADETRQLLEAA